MFRWFGRKVKGHFKKLGGAIVHPLKERIVIDENTPDLKEKVGAMLNAVKGEDPESDEAPDFGDFYDILRHWEIEPHQVPLVIRGLWRRSYFFGLLGIYGFYLLVSSVVLGSETIQELMVSLLGDYAYIVFGWLMEGSFTVISGTILVILGIVAVVTGAWRIQVLKNRRFVPFHIWIFGGGRPPAVKEVKADVAKLPGARPGTRKRFKRIGRKKGRKKGGQDA